MNFRIRHITAILPLFLCLACNHETSYPVLDQQKLANEYYHEDAQWYLDNIPFFECSDKQIEQVYYYRWKLYKAHIRHTGTNQYVITEFINHVPWDREPFCTINAASMHHIYEGRWLKHQRYMDGYINYLYQDGGNDRRYTESIADASYARYLVNGDSAFIIRQLDSMQRQYNEWSDHLDSSKNLYYIAAMPDATEYTIASIDATGGKDGFDDGEAFRPTINSYMYGNAMAIAKIAAMKKDAGLSNEYIQKATTLRKNIENNLWNDSLQHFCDRFKVDNNFVHYWNFIRGRELAGMIPWCFDLPSDNPTYSAAWKHVIDTSQLIGPFGFRTQEPSYEYYFHQYQFFQGQRGSQWNGPSWPYQTSQVLTGMANLLNDYKQQTLSPHNYPNLLRLYTMQHYLPNGSINLVENYDPNLGGPIVYFYWSNHYNHSSFNNLVISGLCGIRPSASDTLVLNPLLDDSIDYFCLQDLPYHGHKLTVIFDRDGNKYKLGKGLSVFLDGKRKELIKKGDKNAVIVGKSLKYDKAAESPDFALNLAKKDYPIPSSSVNNLPDSLYQAIDGKKWYFPEISNHWTTAGSTHNQDWFALDFGQPKEVSRIMISLYGDDKTFAPPEQYSIEYRNEGQWQTANVKGKDPGKLLVNTTNEVIIDKITAKEVRVNFMHETKQVALVELECY